MGLAEVQGALARLYTEDGLRRRFLAAPAAVGAELGLTPGEAAQVGAISAGQLEFYADSLIAKRRREVEKMLPLTCRALGRDFRPAFAKHAQSPPAGGLHRHRRDALDFAASLGGRAGVAPPVRDLARYESAWLEACDRRAGLLMRLFRYPVGLAAGRVTEGASPDDLPGRLTLGLWLRPPRGGPCRHWLLPSGWVESR